jgi:allantoicase
MTGEGGAVGPGVPGDAAGAHLIDLASRALGGSVLVANDETYAEKENLIKVAEPTFTPATMGPRGQIYDGWETRRRRDEGSDWVILRLGVPGVVHRVVVDTAFFLGNYPAECDIETCWLDGWPAIDELVALPHWHMKAERQTLKGGTANVVAIPPTLATHLRLTIHPDGGVARLRVLGEVVPDPRRWAGLTVDLAAADNGGAVLDASDRFFSPPENAIRPGHAVTMGDGWETRRRRGGGCDWLLLALAAPGRIRQFSIDTVHFVGNSPGAVRLTAVDSTDAAAAALPAQEWPELLRRTGVPPDTRHWFGRDAGLDTERTVDRVRVELIPDGGVGRLRLWGMPSSAGRAAVGTAWWNLLPPRDAARQVRSCCASPGWAAALAAERPVADVDALCAASERITRALPWDDVLAALAGHARIGQAPGGAGREAAVSRQEQAGVADDPALHAALAAGNQAYEERFGHVYLVRAAGRSGEQMLALLRERLGNDDATERDVVRDQLAEITSLRLRRLWEEGEV